MSITPEISISVNDVQLVVEPVTPEVTITATGPVGPPGGSWTHTQSTAATTWTIWHGFGYYPNVTVMDSSGRIVITAVSYPSLQTVQITFTTPFSGTAHLS